MLSFYILCDFEHNYRLQVPLVRYESKLQGGNCGSPPVKLRLLVVYVGVHRP